MEGSLELKPTSYNVVLEDGTYKGEIKIGLKFISKVSILMKKPKHLFLLYILKIHY